MHQFFGIDVGAPGLLSGRSWRWLRARIIGCLDVEKSRIARYFAPPEKQPSTKGGGGQWR